MGNEHNFRRDLLRIVGTVAIVLSFDGRALRGAEASRADRPNIVCILADDMVVEALNTLLDKYRRDGRSR